MNKLSARRPRKSAPKTRSGCFTCKARHIRCDQKRPECENCTSSSRRCEGYPTLPADTASGAQNSPQNLSSISSYSIPFKVPGSQADRQLLHYYCCQAAWNLSSYADPTLWTELILQRSQDQPVIRSGLVALSSLHKDFVSGSFSVNGKDKLSTSVEAMTLVSKCYGQLNNYLARSDASPDVALICSVIFYSLESLLGDTRQAISHLDSGLRLLRRTLSEAKRPTDQLLVHLTSLFERLDIQASSYDDLRLPVLELVSPQETRGELSVVPDSFRNLDHAERILAKLQNWTLRQLILYVEHKGKSPGEFPEGLWHERVVLRQQYEKYRQTLNRLDSTPANSPLDVPEISTQEERRQLQRQQFLLLQISFHTFYSLVEENVPISADAAGYTVNDEDTLSTALSKVITLLSLASNSASHFASASFPLASPSQRTYTLSTFLVGTLYFLCLKTTNPENLTTACRLFSHPVVKNSRDGLWDSRLAELVIKNVMEIRDRSIVVAAVPDIGEGEMSSQGAVLLPFDVEHISLGNERTDYFSMDFSLISDESDLIVDAPDSFLAAADSFLLPVDMIAQGMSMSMSASGTNSPYPSEGSSTNASETSLPYAHHRQRIEHFVQHPGPHDRSRAGYVGQNHSRLEQDQTQSAAGKTTTSSSGQYMQIRPKTQPGSHVQRNNIPQQSTVLTERSHRSGRLEDFALGIVDVDGGVEEAAKRVSVMSI
ncbi:uncharacterized protein Z519_02912 [Cladophialophora bantiana CBS 173.52]|uniref:Zn(2)-C6 fungal-type domain-containing protein n=1 Tax=Cladophialophora bantiana (strain ATCC 10958 / CBS 173.52 / CDC B-1940 / NIH 8579) TaxID=1442370 RepID=A0A0D2HQW7_CLAB1|nr:uncharacterized protein Z519_02912 [Cladophialophora bantiana CBS 173.52]KIW95848.1 hypothetical protein Z519_02912 [Cladophialophora bantiana CBS 173.52]